MESRNADWATVVYGTYDGKRCRFPGCAELPSIRLVVRDQEEPAVSWRAPDDRDQTPYYCATHDREAKQHLAMLVKRSQIEEETGHAPV
jgi:hypothetical protein